MCYNISKSDWCVTIEVTVSDVLLYKFQ
jgi:hypothetical protein